MHRIHAVREGAPGGCAHHTNALSSKAEAASPLPRLALGRGAPTVRTRPPGAQTHDGGWSAKPAPKAVCPNPGRG